MAFLSGRKMVLQQTEKKNPPPPPASLKNMKCSQEKLRLIFYTPTSQTYLEKAHHGKEGCLVQIKFIGYYSTNRYLQMFRERLHQSLNSTRIPNKNQDILKKVIRRKTNVAVEQVL